MKMVEHLTSRISVLLVNILWVFAWSNELAADDLAVRASKVLQSHCLRCHNDADKAGDLSLAINPAQQADWDAARFLQLVTPVSGVAEMPKEAPPLSTEELATLNEWIKLGAKWPEGLHLQPPRKLDLNWWSLQPLPSSQELNQRLDTARKQSQASGLLQSQNPVDAFVISKLLDQQLSCSPEASRRILIRRLYYDLIGLPPTPEQIAKFETDKDPQAYEKLVDELLKSPRYGERWARHWLDVAHYADTHGYDKDKPRPNAWPYRDYVIRSLNFDKPWDRFIQEQIAGDELFPDTVDGVEALGFLAAGPWDFVGHAEVPESKIDGKIARHLDRDDMVRTAIQSFMSLTVGCAQCHDHKFDPISQLEYYQLQSVFSAIDRADKAYFDDTELTKRFAGLNAEKKSLDSQLAALDDQLNRLGGERWKKLVQRLKDSSGNKNLNDNEAFGYHSNLEPKSETSKWIQLNFKQPTRVARIIIRPAFDLFANIGADFGLPNAMDFQFAEDKPAPSPDSNANTAQTDFKQMSQWSAKAKPDRVAGTAIVIECDGQTMAQLRIVVSSLTKRLPEDYCFALAEVEVIDDQGNNIARQAEVQSLDSIEAPPRWRRSNLIDGIYPREPSTTQSREALQAERESMRRELLGDAQFQQALQWESHRSALEKQLREFPKPKHVFAGTVHFGSGAFSGTGAGGGRPREIFVLHRGEVTSPRQRVEPAALALVKNLPADLNVPDLNREASRRAALAKWLSSSENSFTWRSIVNRVWQYHFGSGLVDTPNDLGKMGGRPSHPDLLDWLAVEFRDNGQSLKALHRLIVTSQVYRQSSDGPVDQVVRERCTSIDVENRFLWRANRRKLDAESIRDSVLAISGKLDLNMGGPGFEEFVLEKPEHSPHYRYDLLDFENPSTHRRTIYRFTVRSQLQPFLNTLDCADPSIQVATRNQVQSPLQALAMLNNGLVLVHSRNFAERLRKQTSPDNPGLIRSCAEQGFEEVTGRKPTSEELKSLVEYAQSHGLENLCRLLFNLNEFSFLE